MTGKAISKISVVRTLNESDEPLTCNQISERLGVDWHTVKDRIDELIEESRIYRREINSNLVLYSDEEVLI